MMRRDFCCLAIVVLLAGCGELISTPIAPTSIPSATLTLSPTATPSPTFTITPTPTESIDQNAFQAIGPNNELAERLVDMQPFNVRLDVLPERAAEIYQACLQMTYLLRLIDAFSANRIRDHRSIPAELRTFDAWMEQVVQKSIEKGRPLSGLVGWEQHRDARKTHRLNYGELMPIKGNNVDISRCTITLRRPGMASSTPPLKEMIAMKGYWVMVKAIVGSDGMQNMQILLAPSFSIKNNAGFFYASETMKPEEIADNYSDLIATFVEDMRWYTEDMPVGWKEWGSGLLVVPGYPVEKPYIVFLDAAPKTAALVISDLLLTAPQYLVVR